MINIDKKYIVIGAILLGLLIILTLVYFAFGPNTRLDPLQSVNFEGADIKEEIDSGMVWNTAEGPVRMNNIFKGKNLDGNEDLVLSTTSEFTISYIFSGDFIEVILQSEPYSEVRIKAERALSDILGAGTDICKLPIEVYTLSEINDEFRPGGETDYGLSSCSDAINFTQ